VLFSPDLGDSVGRLSAFELSDQQRKRIAELEDRSFTPMLLDAVTDPSLGEDELFDLGRLLNLLNDPRAIGPMTAMLANSSAREEQREIARAFLVSGGHTVDSVTLRNWIANGDDVLARAALSLSDRPERDLLAIALIDMRASFRKSALQATSFGFEEPQWQRLHVAALRDPDASVRACAADLLLWHEPLMAEQPLFVAAADDDEDVAVNALDTLQYYCSLRTSRAVFAHARAAKTLRRQIQARSTIEALMNGFRDHLNHNGVWFDEARTFLADYDAAELPVIETESGPTPVNGDLDPAFVRAAAELHRIRSEKNASLDDVDIVRRLNDPNSQWAITMAVLQRSDPMSIPVGRRAAFGTVLADHVDPDVRMAGTKYLAAFEETELLLQLLDDPNVAVRKSATYALHDVLPSAEVAERVIAPVLVGDVGSTRAYESVRTWARHRSITAPGQFLEELVAFTFEERESVRAEAIEQLVSRNVTSVAARMIELLESPPLMTWSVHTSIRSGRAHLGLNDDQTKRAMHSWADADNLWLQVAIAK
jgi:hypothetical protein